MSQPKNIFQILLEVNKLLDAFKWLLPTQEGRRRRELRRARKKWLKGKITDEQYEQIKKDLGDPSAG